MLIADCSASAHADLSRVSIQSHSTQTLKYILAVWPRDNSRPPSLTLSLARTSERHSRILYPSCTLVACTHAQSLRLCPLSELLLSSSPPHQKKHTLSRERGRDTIVCAARRLRSAVGQRNKPYPELAVRARTRSTLYYRRRLPGLNTYHTTRRCRGTTRR